MNFGVEAVEWLAHQLHCNPNDLTIKRLKGSTSSSVFFIQCPDNTHRFVLRVLDNQTWLAEEPDLAAHEAAALQEAERAVLPAPRLVAYASDEVGFHAPVVLMTFVAGRIELAPTKFQTWLDALARELAHVHKHKAKSFGWMYKSWVNRQALAPPAWSRNPHLWERAIKLWNSGEPRFDAVFLHRDYHPMNVLWAGDAISGVVDWINACRGPAGIDVGHCRLNLAMMYGVDAADSFLEPYINVAEGFKYNPYWDIDTLLDSCIPTLNFYSPWQQFGLDVIAPEVLGQRVDEYLESVIERTG